MVQALQEMRQVDSDEGSDIDLLQRFAHECDDAAFRALVQRHGAMVLAVCNRVLYDRHAAEDAFQVTFLILARKASTIARPELLGNWLHGVAYRVAYKLKSKALRRQQVEAKAPLGSVAEPSLQASWREVQTVLDEELYALPEKYRAPLVLVYLEGKTHDEAAQILRCPVGSMSWRLSQGRTLLHRRLSRRGLTLSGALLLLALVPSAASASETLVEATVAQALLPAGVAERLAAAVHASLAHLGGRASRRGLALLAAILFATSATAFAYASLTATFGDPPSHSSCNRAASACVPAAVPTSAEPRISQCGKSVP